LTLLLALGFVALAWFVGDRRFNAGLWPLWAMSGVFAAATLANLAFDERFTLDARARRWRYRRGWLGGGEGGSFDGLAGLTIEEFRRPALNAGTMWYLSIGFRDGVCFCNLGNPFFPAEEAHAEARHVSESTGSPLVVKPLEC
jgi:hypothetical protein